VKSALPLRRVKAQIEEVGYFRRLCHRQTDLPDPVNECDCDPDERIAAFSKCQCVRIARVDKVQMERWVRYMLGNILPLILQSLIEIRLDRLQEIMQWLPDEVEILLPAIDLSFKGRKLLEVSMEKDVRGTCHSKDLSAGKVRFYLSPPGHADARLRADWVSSRLLPSIRLATVATSDGHKTLMAKSSDVSRHQIGSLARDQAHCHQSFVDWIMRPFKQLQPN